MSEPQPDVETREQRLQSVIDELLKARARDREAIDVLMKRCLQLEAQQKS